MIIPIYNAIVSGFKPPPDLSISQWADKFRYLSSESSAEPGKFDINRMPPQIGIMDAVSSDDLEEIYVMGSSQWGKTETLNNICGYYIDQDPCPILVVMPTARPMAEAWSKDRLEPMLRDTPVLKNKVAPAKSRDSQNTILHKKFDGGHLTVGGANSPSSLASRPIRVLLPDEIDRWPVSAGNEGDPFNLARKRTQTYPNKKIYGASTPTIRDISRIEKLYKLGDQRKYFIPCPYCKTYQILEFGNIECKRDEENKRIPETARYKCANEKCSKLLTEDQKNDAIQKGEWRATAQSQDPKIASFHIWEIYSPWSSMEQIIEKYNEAKEGGRETLKTFWNLVLGQPWEETSFKMNAEVLFERTENYKNFIPEDVLILNAGVDVQGDRIEGLIAGWGLGFECWLIDYFIIYEDPEKDAAWQALDNILLRTYAHPAGVNLRLTSAFIDSGYKSTTVYKYTKAREQLRIYSTKGKGEAGLPILSRASKDRRIGAKFFNVGTWEAKDTLAFRLGRPEPGAGYIHFPNRGLFTIEFFRQLCAERAVTKYKNNVPYRAWEVIRKGIRNEALDNMVLILANIELINPNFPKIKKSFESIIEQKPKVKKQRQQNNNNNWVTGY